MYNSENGISITAFTGEIFRMESALISGVMNDEIASPMSLYSGKLDLEEVHSALFYANRAVIKILMDEFGIPLDCSEEFLLSAVTEAVTEEYNSRSTGNLDVDVRKVLRENRKNQN